jgi:hypothetical protein
MNGLKQQMGIWIGIIGLVVALVPGSAAALGMTDYDAIASQLGTNVKVATTKSFTGIGTPGSLTSSVWLNDGIYRYVLDVTPNVSGAWRLTTGFVPVMDPNANAWYSSSDVLAAGGADAGFTVVLNATNLSWSAVPTNTWWGIGETITFYFESLYAPLDTFGTYNLGASRNGTAQGWAPGTTIPAPVSEPGSLILVGFGLVVVTAASRMLRAGARTTRVS